MTDYITDPAANTRADAGSSFNAERSSDTSALYVRFDPTVNGNGGGGAGNGGADSARDRHARPAIPIARRLRHGHGDERGQPRLRPAGLRRARRAVHATSTSGFAGTASDGLVAARRLARADAPRTRRERTATSSRRRRSLGRQDGDGERFTLALGFGADAGRGGRHRRGLARRRLRQGARRATGRAGRPTTRTSTSRPERCPASRRAGRRSSRTRTTSNANVLKAVEDKTFPGAIVAGARPRRGARRSRPATRRTRYFGSYREVFARDLYEAWTGLMADGDTATARDATLFLFDRQQQPDGSMPRNSLVNGKAAPDSFGTQLDETVVPDPDGRPAGPHRPVALREPHQAGGELRRRPRPVVRRRALGGAGRLLAVDDRRRDRRARRRGRPRRREPRHRLGCALARRGRRLPALDQGLDGDDERPARRRRYFIRLSKTGDPNAAISYNVGNGGPTLDQRSVIDAGLPRARPARRAAAERSGHPRLAARRRRDDRVDDASGPGWHRYNGDGYGDRASDGRPWAPSGQGTGHLWPALSAERGEQTLQTGNAPARRRCCDGMDAVRLRRRPHPRAGLGAPEPRAFAVRHRPRRSPRSASSTGSRPAPRPRSTGRRPRSSGWSPTSAPGRLVDRPPEHVPALRRAHPGRRPR